MTKRCLQLLRVSTESQAGDKASIPSQRAVNQRTAETYGLTIVRTIELSDVSGAQVLLAPEIQEMLRLMNDPEIHGVIVREFSRLMRPENFADYAMLQAFVDSETWLYLPDGPINFASNDGFLMGTMKAAMGGLERREMVKKMWQIKEQKRREGGFSQSPACLPYGVAYPWRYTDDAVRVKEAYRLLLSGDTSYASIARKIGLNAPLVRNILKNPIYTGWRVVDQRRDPSPKAKRARANGRQGDRPKINRAPEDIIRVKVIDDPLVPETDFQQVQRIMAQKRQWFHRMNEGPHRFTYNGLLLCGECQSLLYTKFRRRDYYICKAKCGAPYQRREILEPKLDKLFTRDLTRPAFLKQIVKTMKREPQPEKPERLLTQLKSLDAKRQRILDGYFEGVITSTERDLRQADVLRERKIIEGTLERERPRPTATLESLVSAFQPFVEFDLLNREDKRALLNTLTPSIVASNCRVKGLWVVPVDFLADVGFQEAEGILTQKRVYLRLEAA